MRRPGKAWESSQGQWGEGRPEGRRLASWSQGGPSVPGTAAAGQHPLHGVERESGAGTGSGGRGDGWGRPGWAGGRAPAARIPRGNWWRSGAGETNFPSFARETGFSTMIMIPLHKSSGWERGKTGGSPWVGRLTLALPAPWPPAAPGDEPVPGGTWHH